MPGLELTRFAITAAHRATRLTSRAWYAKYSACGVLLMCPLLLIPGFCIWKCMFDIMHTVDLGIYQTVLPSVLWTLTDRSRRPFRGSTRQKRFDSAYKAYSMSCRGALWSEVKNG